MARENPPTAPASSAQRMLARFGKVPWVVSANANIAAKAQMNENAVTTKASERREPHPPAKSDAPHRKTAITEHPTGPNWMGDDTPDEGTMAIESLSHWHIESMSLLASAARVAAAESRSLLALRSLVGMTKASKA